jgi:hypothetical protein
MKDPDPGDWAKRDEALKKQLRELGKRVRAIKKGAERLSRIAEAREKRLSASGLKTRRKRKGAIVPKENHGRRSNQDRGPRNRRRNHRRPGAAE